MSQCLNLTLDVFGVKKQQQTNKQKTKTKKKGDSVFSGTLHSGKVGLPVTFERN